MPAKSKNGKQSFKKYMLVDGNAIIHRAFHAIQHLSTKSGEPTNAVYGFTVILLKAIKDIQPTHIAVTFDLAEPTFRHKKYLEYKANRVKAADELYQQIPRCKEVTQALGIPFYEIQGYEADDLLGTLAEKIKAENKGKQFEIIIVTGDLDTLQLVGEHVKIYTSRKGFIDAQTYDTAAVQSRFGIKPAQMVDFKSIKGDPSDNIPGIKGIGEKGALDLIKQFGSISGIYKNLHKLKEKTRVLFENQREQLFMSCELSKIVCDVPINYSLQEYKFSQIDYKKVIQLFQDLEFKSLMPKLPKVAEDITSQRAMVIPAKQNDKYFLVDTSEKLKALALNLKKQEEFAFDTETESLGALDFELVGISFCYVEGESYYVPAELLRRTGFGALSEVFSDKTIRKIAHNFKYDYLALKKFGIDVQGIYFDTMIASYLLAPGSRSHDLDTLVFNEFGYQMQPIEELIGKGKEQLNMANVPLEKICFYACEDADFCFRLKNLLLPRLKKEKLDSIFFEIEMPLVKVLAAMEENGILIDFNVFKALEKQVSKQISVFENEIHELAGEKFNVNSPAQLKIILFEKLQVHAGDIFIKKTKTGLSTAASELEKMRGMHKIIDLILEYRELNKLQNTYISVLPHLASKRDGRVHSSFNQTIAATGRLSSSNPNLQNIPAGDAGVAREIRRGFIAAPRHKLLYIDYSQIELRVVAHLSGDENMINIFNQGLDIHAATAMRVYSLKDAADVTRDMRRKAKEINFGVLYGLSSFGLSERVQMSVPEAADFIKKYFQAFPAVDTFLKSVISQTKITGYAENELGRRRYLPEINSSQFQVRSAAERAAVNMPIQSLAADIIKIAMNKISASMDMQSQDFKLLLQIHDALVFEVRDDLVAGYADKLKKIMETAYKLKVPLTVDAKVAANWGEI